jgi:hypothetical protein
MEQTLEHRIRQRAYEIWHARGQADGKADEHWLAAEREVLSSLRAHAPAPNVKATPKSPKRTRADNGTVGQRSAKSSKASAAERSRS